MSEGAPANDETDMGSESLSEVELSDDSDSAKIIDLQATARELVRDALVGSREAELMERVRKDPRFKQAIEVGAAVTAVSLGAAVYSVLYAAKEARSTMERHPRVGRGVRTLFDGVSVSLRPTRRSREYEGREHR